MEKYEKAKVIVELVTRKYEESSMQHIQAAADLAKAETGDKLFKEREEREGNIGWSQSPYNVEQARKRGKSCLSDKMNWQAIRDYAVDTFLQKL